LNYNRSLPFHGDTGSIPVRDAKFLSLFFEIYANLVLPKCFLMDVSGQAEMI